MIIPAFFVASMVGFHVEFSQPMYSSKCPYSTPISCTRVTGPSAYLRSSRALALSESEKAARHIDKIKVLVIFSSPVVIHPQQDGFRNILMLDRTLHKYINITMIVPTAHDPDTRR